MDVAFISGSPVETDLSVEIWRRGNVSLKQVFYPTFAQEMQNQRVSVSALVVTIGDTQVDFPMHQNAHIAFHVGQEEVWRDHPLPHCVMV